MRKASMFAAPTIAVCIAGAATVSQSALAGSVILTLKRTSLMNVTDTSGKAGLYQYEAGSVSAPSGVVVGSYQTTRRVTNGGGTQFNAAATQVTLFFKAPGGVGAPENIASGNVAPENIVLEGAHVFSSGGFTGSVSAASPRYRRLRDGDAAYTIRAANTTLLHLVWNGPNLVFP